MALIGTNRNYGKQENFGVWNINVRTTHLAFKRNPGAQSTWPANPRAPRPGPPHSQALSREKTCTVSVWRAVTSPDVT